MAYEGISVRITGKGIGHEIEIDGHRVENFTIGASLEIDPSAGCPVLTLRLIPGGPLGVETRARVLLDAETEEALKAMGWTPPGGDA